jgi:hypothetical protein
MKRGKNISFKVWLEIERYNEKTGHGEDVDEPCSCLGTFDTYEEARGYAEAITQFADCINL